MSADAKPTYRRKSMDRRLTFSRRVEALEREYLAGLGVVADVALQHLSTWPRYRRRRSRAWRRGRLPAWTWRMLSTGGPRR